MSGEQRNATIEARLNLVNAARRNDRTGLLAAKSAEIEAADNLAARLRREKEELIAQLAKGED